MTNLHDVLDSHVADGSVPGAVGLVARGDRVEVQAVGSVDADGTSPMAPGLDLPHRLDHQAHHRRGGDDAGRGRPDRARRPGRAVAAGAGVTGRSSARRPARSTTWSRPPGRSPWLDLLTFRAGYGFPSDFSLPAVGLLFSELKQGPPQPQLVAAPDEWMAALSRHPAAAPAGRGVALQHLLRHPGRADRPGLGPAAARVPGRAAVRAARHGRHRVRGTGRQARTGSPATTGPIRRAVSSWSTPRTGSGAARRRSRPAPAAWSRPPTTGSPSPGCCSPAAPSTAGSCCRRRRCGR